MITKVFWTVVAVDCVAAFLLRRLFQTGGHGLLVAMYLAVLAGILVTILVFPLLRSEGLRVAAFIVLLIPSAPLTFFSAAAAVRSVQTERQFSGSAYFSGPAFELAEAMVRCDPVLVKQRIPAAGDLNQPHRGGTSLWQFGVLQAENNDQSIEMLRALVAGGADPKRGRSAHSLLHAAARGPRLTQFLLEAGENPNLLDHEHRPLWWATMQAGEDESATELLSMMLDHGADLTLRAPDGRGPVGYAVGKRCWYAAALLIEHGADWKQEKLPGAPVPELMEWEILRRDEYPLPVPQKLRKVVAGLKGEPLVSPAARARSDGEIRIPDLLRYNSFEKLEETRAGVSRLAQQPNWVRRVMAFFEEGNTLQRHQAALILSLKPEALPEDVQERCWSVVREQVDWYSQNVASAPSESHGWLLRQTSVIATGLASIPGPVRERHRADFTGLRDRIEECRRANDPAASKLADLKKVDWTDAP